jgi:hypothetical protein
MPDTPFDNIENAQEYLALLLDAVDEAKQNVLRNVTARSEVTNDDKNTRHVEALRVVAYKLEQLDQQIKRSHRILNDLRILKSMLLAEKDQGSAARGAA